MQLSSIVKSHKFHLALAFVLGGVFTSLFLQSSIRRETSVKTETAVKSDVKKSVGDKKTSTDSQKTQIIIVRKVKYKLTKPDGTILESEIYESNTEQVARIRQEESSKYQQLIASLETKVNTSTQTLEIIKNQKKLNVSVGYAPSFFTKPVYTLAISYNLWGPMTVGVMGGSNGLIAPTVGITF